MDIFDLTFDLFLQIERALCDELLSNFRSSTLSRAIFDAIVQNWHPELYPDVIVDDEDFVGHLFCFVSGHSRLLASDPCSKS